MNINLKDKATAITLIVIAAVILVVSASFIKYVIVFALGFAAARLWYHTELGKTIKDAAKDVKDKASKL